MRIDIWSDFVCPFCHLGRRQLTLALEQFEHADDIDVIWHSYQLDRNAPARSDQPQVERVAHKYGVEVDDMREQHRRMASAAAELGLDFQWERTVGSNTYDAHRLHHFARAQGRETAYLDRVMRGWYSEGEAIGDRDTLVRLATEAGLDEARVREVLEKDEHGIDVRTDETLAARLGIGAVPAFVIDLKYKVDGAQGVDVLLQAIRYAWDDQGNRPEVAEGGGCGGDCGSCGCGGDAKD